MDDLLKVLNFQSPSRVDSQDISSNYFIHNTLNQKSLNDYYRSGEELQFITNANSNQYLDSRASYIFFRATVYQTTTRGAIGDIQALDTYVLNSGLPFDAVRETVNNNTVINEMANNFNRYSQGRFYCSSKPLHNKRVQLYATAPPAGFPFNNVSDDFDYSISEEYAGCGVIDRVSRGRGITLFKRDSGTTLFEDYIYFYIPLNCVSALAGANQLLPIGYLSQISQIGLRIDLRITETLRGVNIAFASDASLQDTEIRIFEPKLFGRYLTIHNPEMQQVLYERFKRVNPESPLLIPYNRVIYDNTYRFETGQQFLKCRYNISKRSLKGLMLRFSSDTVLFSISIDSNITDADIRFKTLQISSGGKNLPVQQYKSISPNDIKSYNAQQYNIARHIFDPNNTYSTTGCITRNFYNEPISTNKPKFYLFDFENFRMNPEKSEEVAHANGLNTFVLGNNVDIEMELTTPISSNLIVEAYFVYNSTLYVSDNYIDDVENKSIL